MKKFVAGTVLGTALGTVFSQDILDAAFYIWRNGVVYTGRKLMVRELRSDIDKGTLS